MYTDPCNGYGEPGTETDPVVAANCASEGLPPDFVGFASAQAWGFRQGNEALEPESADSWTVGFVFSPAALPDLVVSLDWFNIEIEDAIGSAGTQNIINACYASPGFSSPLCDLLVGPAAVGDQPSADPNRPFRNVFDDISGVDLTLYNLSIFETSGIDASLRYGFDAAAGRVDIALEGTWLNEYRFQAGPGTPELDYAGKFGPDPYFGKRAAFPEWQANLGIGLSRDNWGARWTTRYLSGVDDLDGSAGKASSATGSTFYHDVQGHYGWDVLTLTAGIRNVFDRQPPYVTAYDDMNTLPASYDTAGRYYYVRATLRF